MPKLIYILIYILICLSFKAQVNFVLNPSFEITDSCVIADGKMTDAANWENNGNSSSFCVGVLISTCCIYPTQCGVNTYANGSVEYQFPKTGNSYCTIEVFSPPPPPFGYTNLRRYVVGRLNSTLINGKSYCGKVYVNLSNLSPYKINRFGMYFDNGALIGTQLPDCKSILPVIPQIQNNVAIMLDDSLNWMKIEGVFTANGTESRVTIGNYTNDAGTIGIATGFITNYLPAEYNIDDVSLIATDITAYAGNDVIICVSDSIHLGRPQEVGLECLWYKPSIATPFASTSDIWFKPTQTGVYTFVQRMDNCAITWDTVNVTVIQDCASLQPTTVIPNVFTPNGDGVNDVWAFSLPTNCTLSGAEVYNRWGLLIKNLELNTHNYVVWDGRSTSGEACSDGVYYYTLTYKLGNGDMESKKGFISLIR